MRSFPFHALPALFSVLALLACGGGIEVKKTGTRAVVIGIDGADWKIIEALAAEGEMTNLMGLRERGTWGPIETLNDVPLSPVIWTSVATGKTPAKHGVTWFMVDQPDGTRVPVRSFNRKTKAIWNILGDHGRRPTVLGWWATYPAEDVGKGAIVSDALGYHGFGSTARGGEDSKKTYPAELYETAFARIPAEQQIPADFVQRFVHLSEAEYREEMYDPARFPRHDPVNPIHLFQQYAVTAQGYTAIAEDLLENRDHDLFLVYFEQVDSFSHLFMKYAPPRLEWVDERGFDRYRDLVSEWYKYQDELLGRVLAQVDLETTAVFLLSDHGFKSGSRRIRSEQTVDVKRAHLDHETDGVFLAAGPQIRAGAKVAGASVLDLTPTVLHYLGFPIAKDMDGKVLDRVFLPEFMVENPIRYVTSYEDESSDETPTQIEDYDADEQAANERALRALGYLGGSEEAEPASELPAGEAEESSPEMHNSMGRSHLRNGEPDRARQEFQKALALDPSNADALLNLASIHRIEGRVADAEHLVRRALQVDPNSIGALSQLAELRRDQSDLADAVRLFEEALGIDNSQPFLYLGYGDVLQRAGRLTEAEKAFKAVLEL
ncbi:MAG: tetratricopeptide repeat protein, partial [bacterium]|nr:tetratricopeptide repeat protein [bacterium]